MVLPRRTGVPERVDGRLCHRRRYPPAAAVDTVGHERSAGPHCRDRRTRPPPRRARSLSPLECTTVSQSGSLNFRLTPVAVATSTYRWQRSPEVTPPRFDMARALEPIVAAASRGRYEALITATERAFAQLFGGASVSLLLRSGGAWREWSALEGDDDRPEAVLPPESL